MENTSCTPNRPVTRVSNGTGTILVFVVYKHSYDNLAVSILTGLIADFLARQEGFRVVNYAISYKNPKHPSIFKISLDYTVSSYEEPTSFEVEHSYGCLRGPVLRALSYVINLNSTPTAYLAAELDNVKSLASEFYEAVSDFNYLHL